MGSSDELFNFGSWISTQFFMAVFMVITIFCQTLIFAKKKRPKKVIKIFIFLHIFKALYLRPLPFSRSGVAASASLLKSKYVFDQKKSARLKLFLGILDESR